MTAGTAGDRIEGMMATPLPGDLVVRWEEVTEQYWIVEAESRKWVAGPFDDERHAFGVALFEATKRSGRYFGAT